jgi:hypothetical protein
MFNGPSIPTAEDAAPANMEEDSDDPDGLYARLQPQPARATPTDQPPRALHMELPSNIDPLNLIWFSAEYMAKGPTNADQVGGWALEPSNMINALMQGIQPAFELMHDHSQAVTDFIEAVTKAAATIYHLRNLAGTCHSF